MEEFIINGIEYDKIDINKLQPLVLAYIGDAVYEVYVRTKIVLSNKMKVNQLHRESIKYVKAAAQADIYRKIEENLTEEEKLVFKKGRNAKSNTVPKNAKISDYKYATGFEALIGYLYLSKQYKRLNELINISINN